MLKHKQLHIIKKITLLILPLFILSLLLSFASYGCKQENEATIEEKVDVVIKKEDIVEEDISVNQSKLIDDKFKEYVDSIELQVNEFIDLSYEDKEYLMEVAYKAVDDYFAGSGESAEPLFLEKYDNINRKVFVGFRVNAKIKGSVSARKDNLAESVYVATLRTLEDQRFEGGLTEDDVKDLKIAIIILGDEDILDEQKFEKGIHGLRIEKGEKGATYYNTVAIEGNHSLGNLLKKLCEKAGLGEDCYEDEDVNIYYFPTIHFATTRFSDEITTFYRCNVIDYKPDINKEKIKKSLDLAEGWMLVNLNTNGYFNYEYDPSKGEYIKKDNELRQLLCSRWLAEKSKENETIKQMHKINLEYIIRNWYKEDNNFGYIFFDNKSKLGSIAMALRVLVYSPFFENYREEAIKLANTILKLQNEDGSFKAWYIEPDYSYNEDELLKFYSGEAILSLVELYKEIGEQKYLDSAIKAQDFYLIKYVEQMEENYYPGYVPWHTKSLYELYLINKSDKYADAIFKLNDEIIKMQNQDGKPYIDYLGRFYDPDRPEYGTPFSGSTAVDIDGLIDAYKMAELKSDVDRMYEYKKSIFLGAHNLINLQFDGPDMYYLGHPERVEGAIRYAEGNNRIRIDSTQHTIDAFSKILDVFKLD